MTKVKFAIKILTIILMVFYPFIIFFGLKTASLSAIALLVIFIASLRYFSFSSIGQHKKLGPLKSIAILTILLALLSLIFKQVEWMLFYPVAVNALMLGTFSYSLFSPPPIIEKLARLRTPDLPKKAIAYTRKVTQVWCVFFFINGAIAAITTQLSLEIWSLYNGLISYIIMGGLFLGEWLIRQKVMRS